MRRRDEIHKIIGYHQAVGFGSPAKEAHTFKDSPGGGSDRRHRSGTENQALSGGEVVLGIYLSQIDAHGEQTLPVGFIFWLEDSLHPPPQQLDCCGRDDSFWCCANPHHCMHTRPAETGKYRGHQIAIGYQAHSGTHRAKMLDEILIPRTVEHGDGQLPRVVPL